MTKIRSAHLYDLMHKENGGHDMTKNETVRRIKEAEWGPTEAGLNTDITIENEATMTKLRTFLHASDCAVHNAPAYTKGECDCERGMGVVVISTSPGLSASRKS